MRKGLLRSSKLSNPFSVHSSFYPMPLQAKCIQTLTPCRASCGQAVVFLLISQQNALLSLRPHSFLQHPVERKYSSVRSSVDGGVTALTPAIEQLAPAAADAINCCCFLSSATKLSKSSSFRAALRHVLLLSFRFDSVIAEPLLLQVQFALP